MTAADYMWVDDGLTINLFDTAGGGPGFAIADAIEGQTSQARYFLVGTSNAAAALQASSDPGVDPITLSIIDSAPGSGVEVVHIRLALSEALLASAVPGDPVNLGDTILGGVNNAVKVFYDWQWQNGVLLPDGTPALPESFEIALRIPNLVEVPA